MESLDFRCVRWWTSRCTTTLSRAFTFSSPPSWNSRATRISWNWEQQALVGSGVQAILDISKHGTTSVDLTTCLWTLLSTPRQSQMFSAGLKLFCCCWDSVNTYRTVVDAEWTNTRPFAALIFSETWIPGRLMQRVAWRHLIFRLWPKWCQAFLHFALYYSSSVGNMILIGRKKRSDNCFYSHVCQKKY